MFLRLLVESLRRARRRKLLASGAITLGVAGLTAIASVFLIAGDSLARESAGYGANLEIAAASDAGTLPEADLPAIRKIFWRNNVVALAPRLEPSVQYDGAVVAPLVGTWFDLALPDGWRTGLPRTRPALTVDGRWPRDDAREIVLGRRLAARLGRAVGATVTVALGDGRAEAVLVGVVGGGGEEEDRGFVPLALVQRLVGRPGVYTRAELFALTVPETAADRRDPRLLSPEEYEAWYCTAFPSAVALQIEEALPGSRVSVVRGVGAAAGELLGRLRQVLIVLAVVLAAGAVLGTTAAMAATVLERRIEVGVLAALGAERARIAGFFLTEAAILGVLSGALGGALGLLAGRFLGSLLFAQAAAWPFALVPAAVLAGVAIAIAGSLPPVARAVAVAPALVLKKAAA